MAKEKNKEHIGPKVPKIRWLTKHETLVRFGKVLGFMIFFGLVFVGLDALVVLIRNGIIALNI